MKKATRQAGIVALLIVFGLSWSSNSMAATLKSKFHQFEGENLITADQIPPIDKVGEYELDGKKITLEIETDKDRIGIAPGSRIKFTVRLLVDGKPLDSVSELGEIFPRGVFASYARSSSPAILRVNTPKLEQNLNINLHNDVWLDDGTEKNRLASEIRATDNCVEESQPYWSDLITGKEPRAEVANQLISDKIIFQPSDNGMASLDFSEAEVTAEFVYGGVRVLPFIEIAVGLVGPGGLNSQKVVFFEDQLSGRASRLPNSTQPGEDVYYEVAFDRKALSPGNPATVMLSISARDPQSKQIVDTPWQRVRIMAVPLYKYVELKTIGSSSQSDSGYRNNYFNDDRPYNPLQREPRRQAGLTVRTPGQFALSQEQANRYSSTLTMSDYSSMRPGGGYTVGFTGSQELNQPCTSPAAIEVDLIDGQAEIPFAYNGQTGPAGQLTFIVQPANYFMPYEKWEEGVPVNFDEYFRRRLTEEQYDETRSQLMTYRESQNIIYPLDRLEEDDTKRDWNPSLGFPFISSPTLYLYGDRWLTYPEQLAYRSETFTVASIPIGSVVGPGLGFWWWVLIGHIIKIVLLGGWTVYLRKKIKTVTT